MILTMTDAVEPLERRDPLIARPLKDIPLRELEQEFSALLTRLDDRRYVASILRVHFEPDGESHSMEINFRVRVEKRSKERSEK
jgi:hypothetical protein